ncbi:MAG: glutamate-5-semialdehyde dehydrogenase [Oscillospiraceae bacterium]
MTDLIAMGKAAREAAVFLAQAPSGTKDAALEAISKALIENTNTILAANAADLDAARKNGMSVSMLDRLALTASRLEGIANAVIKVKNLPDPVGEVTLEATIEKGLKLRRVRVPLGVIGIIFEARPNVTVDSAVLCLKSGNAVILRGGKEMINSNIELERVMRGALRSVGVPEAAVSVLHDTSRETAREMMRLRDYIDLLIPRGGGGLIKSVIENATVPVIQTGVGNCHVYIDRAADLEMAVNIIYNAKTSRVSVCNAAETLLVHRDVADVFLPMAKALLDKKNVELRCCERARTILPGTKAATEEDYATEFSDYILAVRVVDSLDEAIAHIAKYTTYHSEAIVTGDKQAAEAFTHRVDAAAVYVNASTRFTDGEMFGFGAEIGISTQKMHARGPMGLPELCSYKYIVHGNGQIR